MAGKHGIENLTKVMLLGLAVGAAIEEASAAGTKLGKAVAFVSALDEAAALLTLDTEGLRDEVEELDAEDREALKDQARAAFDIKDDELEAKVETSIDAALDLIADLQRLADVWVKDGEAAAS